MKTNNFDEYRNEIKYLLYGVSRKTLFIQYKLSSLLLSKSYPDRWVNNIYFDNINLENSKLIYQGWMISSSPAATPLEHPIYDLWLKDCKIDTDF